MKFKIDENLPVDGVVILRDAGFEADTVFDERLVGADDSVIANRSRAQDRVLVTLDLDFSNIRAYPPSQHAGIVVLRPNRQDKRMGFEADGTARPGPREPNAGGRDLDRRNGSNSLPRPAAPPPYTLVRRRSGNAPNPPGSRFGDRLDEP